MLRREQDAVWCCDGHIRERQCPIVAPPVGPGVQGDVGITPVVKLYLFGGAERQERAVICAERWLE